MLYVSVFGVVLRWRFKYFLPRSQRHASPPVEFSCPGTENHNEEDERACMHAGAIKMHYWRI